MQLKNILLSGLLCLALNAHSQQNPKDSSSLIGKSCPDFHLNNILNYSSSTGKISDFRGKWLVLDFWATWCGACVSEFPREDSILQKFKNRIQVLGVTTEQKPIAQTFMDKRKKAIGIGLPFPSVTADTALYGYFPHVYIPHMVWIDPQGIIAAITDGEEFTFDQVQNVVTTNQIHLAEKKDHLDPNFKTAHLLFINNNGGVPDSVVSYEILAKGFKPGLIAAGSVIDSTRILLTNYLIPDLYQLAFGGNRRDLHFGLAGGFPQNRMKIKIEDSSVFIWSKQHLNEFCYDLYMPTLPKTAAGIDTLFAAMQFKLLRTLPYKVKIVREKTLCLVLVRMPNFSLKKSTAKEGQFDYDDYMVDMKKVAFQDLVDQMRYIYFQMDKKPFIDESNLTDTVDLTLNAKLRDPKGMGKTLQKYGLDIIEDYRDVDMLVISDK